MTNIPIPRATDEVVLEFFEKLHTDLGFQVASVRYLGNNHAQTINETFSGQFRGSITFAITQCNAALPNIVSLQFVRSDQNAVIDRITIDPGQQPLPIDKAIKLDALLNKTFRSNVTAAAALYGDNSPFSEVMKSHEIIATQLEQNLSQVTQTVGNTLQKLGTDFAQERRALEAEFKSRRDENQAQTDALAKRLQDEYEKQAGALAEREKNLNDRDNTHVRREIREQMKRRLQEHAQNFTLTKSTQRLRLPIHAIVVISLIALGAYIYFLSSRIDLTISGSYLLLIKPALLTIAALGILTWYIRWMNKWFEQHADAEFYLKQFDLDVDRASLVVETAMEWKATQQADIPTPLLDSLARNLFVRAEKQEADAMHPADYLASAILGNAARARLKLGNAEIDYSRGALKKAARAIEDE